MTLLGRSIFGEPSSHFDQLPSFRHGDAPSGLHPMPCDDTAAVEPCGSPSEFAGGAEEEEGGSALCAPIGDLTASKQCVFCFLFICWIQDSPAR